MTAVGKVAVGTQADVVHEKTGARSLRRRFFDVSFKGKKLVLAFVFFLFCVVSLSHGFFSGLVFGFFWGRLSGSFLVAKC
jgi:hypothetical protein